MRLIDADALKDTLYEVMDKYDGYDPDDGKIIQGLMEADELINTALTIEAAPVVHGRWIEDDARGCRCCSVCEFEVHDDASHVMFGDWRIAPKYCPNCGARMDGDGDA